MHGERIAPFEVLSRHRDGREIPVSVSLAALCNDAGRVVGVTQWPATSLNRRLAAQALRERAAARSRFSTTLPRP
jgi:hypothetical protein